jgi:DNA repair protein RadC
LNLNEQADKRFKRPVALREDRQSLTIDTPEATADLCSEMRFLDRDCLRVVLLNAKQHVIKVAIVSQDRVNESLAHPREVFKPAEPDKVCL